MRGGIVSSVNFAYCITYSPRHWRWRCLDLENNPHTCCWVTWSHSTRSLWTPTSKWPSPCPQVRKPGKWSWQLRAAKPPAAPCLRLRP